MPIYPGSLQISYDFSNPSCYSGSGNTVFSLVGGYTGSIGSGVAFTTENDISFFRFNDANPNDNIVTNFNVISNTNFTYNVWCRPNTSTLTVPVFSGNNGNGTGPYISYNAGWPSFLETWLFSAGFGNGTINPSTLFYPNNNWYMISYSQDGTTGKLFVNGQLIGTGNATGVSLPGASTIFSLGGNPGAGSPDYSFTGDIAIGQLYSSALSDAQIANLFFESNLAFTQKVKLDFSNPASYPGSGTAVYDLTPNNNDFAFQNNNFTYTTTYGGEVFIDNTNILKTVAPLSGFAYTTSAVSMNMWMQLNVEGGANLSMFAALNDTGGAGSHNVLFFGTQTGPTLFFSDNTDSRLQNTTFPLNEWKMITLTKPANGGSNSVKMYVDGQEVTFTSAGTATTINLASSNSFINSVVANLGVWSCDMTLGEYTIWDAELSSTEILTYYNATKGRFLNLVAKYDLNDPLSYSGTGSTLFDLTGNNYDITLDYGPTYHTYSGYNALEFNRTSGTTATRVGSIGLGTTNPQFTFAMWVKPIDLTNPVNYSWIFSYGKENGAIGGAPMVLGQYNGALNLTASFGSARAMYQSGIALTNNEWAFLTTTCDGTNHKLYLNGTFLGQAALSGAQIETPEVLAINYLTGTGIGQCTFEFNYLEIYNRAITAGEISTIYTNTVGRFASPPPAYQGRVGGRQFAQGFNG